MRVAIGSDHAGFELKQHLVATLETLGHEPVDLGTDSTESVDYPAFCAAVGRAVVRGDAERGIVIGGSGEGEQLAANKVRGIRTALCNELYTARMSRQHNDANVVSLGARVVAFGLADEIVELWLATDYEGGRHQRRVDQLAALEERFADPAGQDAYLDSLVPGITSRAAGGARAAGAPDSADAAGAERSADSPEPMVAEPPSRPYEGDNAS